VISDRILVVGRGGVDTEVATQMATQSHQVAIPDQATRAFHSLVYQLNISTAMDISSYLHNSQQARARDNQGRALDAFPNTILRARTRCGGFSVASIPATLTCATRKAVSQRLPEINALGRTGESTTVSFMEESLPVPLTELERSTPALGNSIEFATLLHATTTRFMSRKLDIQEGDLTPTVPADWTRL
jgi:hypothetical protein